MFHKVAIATTVIASLMAEREIAPVICAAFRFGDNVLPRGIEMVSKRTTGERNFFTAQTTQASLRNKLAQLDIHVVDGFWLGFHEIPLSAFRTSTTFEGAVFL